MAQAVRSARVDEVRRLLREGAQPTAVSLYLAAGLRDTAILEMLIAAEGDVNARAHLDDRGSMELTPLFGAAIWFS